MEETELANCEPRDLDSDDEPPPPPFPTRRDNISASFVEIDSL